jgi:hypothetical protein
MISRKKRGPGSSKTLGNELTFTFEPVYLSEAEDDERIKRLSQQILAVVERAKRERRRIKDQLENGLLEPSFFDDLFGLKGCSV